MVVATIELDRLPEPPVNGREVLKGRTAKRDQAIALASTGLSSRSIARIVDEPYGTVYAWLRKAGALVSREEWLR